jgi:hypothetical protein
MQDAIAEDAKAEAGIQFKVNNHFTMDSNCFFQYAFAVKPSSTCSAQCAAALDQL